MKIDFAIIAIIIFVVGIFIVVIYKNVNSLRMIDGVKDINGIRYIVRNVSVAYVMSRLEAVRMSEIIESKEFEKLGENKGRIVFGGVKYNLGTRGSGGDFNIGATYLIECEQQGEDVMMIVKFEGRNRHWAKPDSEYIGPKLNQAYHRWFKEILDLEVYKEP